MSTLLVLRSSVNGEASFSNKMLDDFIQKSKARWPQTLITERDLDAKPVPPLNSDSVLAIRQGVADSESRRAALALSDTLIAELKAADYIAIGLPRYNFTVPASVKCYVDYVARPGVTFAYGENGPQGLLPDVPVFAFVASGGEYAGTAADYLSGWVQQMFGFIGLKNIKFIHAEGLAYKAEEAMQAACQQIDNVLSC